MNFDSLIENYLDRGFPRGPAVLRRLYIGLAEAVEGQVLREVRDEILKVEPGARVMIDGEPYEGDFGVVIHKQWLLQWFEEGGRFEVGDG